jgi:hypothetical protein
VGDFAGNSFKGFAYMQVAIGLPDWVCGNSFCVAPFVLSPQPYFHLQLPAAAFW